MSANWSEDVAEFMRAMGQQVQTSPIADDVQSTDHVILNAVDLYCKLIDEEYHELRDAASLSSAVDGAIDLIWVTLGFIHSVGVDPQPIWDAVAAANMAKSTGPVREDGKRLKPEGWTHPDIAALIDAQRKAVAN